MEEKLLNLLLEDQVVTQDQYQQVVQEAERTGHHVEAILQQFDILSEQRIVEYLSKKFHMPVIRWENYAIDQELLELLPETLAIKYMVFPFELERGGKRGGRMTLAVSNPSDVAAIDEIAFRTGCTVKAAISSTRAIRQAIQQYYGVEDLEELRPGSSRIEQAPTAAERFPATQIEAFDTILTSLLQSIDLTEDEADVLSTLDQESPASKVLVELLEMAVDREISEIHLEPFNQEYRVRIRMRGVLQAHTTIPEHVGRDMAIRLRRIMQRTETGVPNKRDTQSWIGAFHTDRIRKSSLTVVVSFYPTLYGEKILLKPTTLGSLRSVDQLGLTEDSLKLLQRLLAKAEGMLLIMGPPDHGKTTTLYSLLKHYQQAVMDVLMLESPVELIMPGITQISGHTPLSYDTWQSFVAYTHPDVLAISDLEDELMLRLAFEFAPTTQVLASYTAGNSLNGLRTLTESINAVHSLHLPALLPVLLDTLNGIIVQRLVRTLCPHCKEDIPDDDRNPGLLQRLGIEAQDTSQFPLYRAKGCQECMDTGYQGQTGLFEIIRCDKHVTQALLQHPPISFAQWDQVLADQSVHTLQQQGAQLIRNGLSSPQEVWRALSA